MVDYKVTDTELTSIANAIRTKGGTQAQLEFPNGFVSAVQAIPTGGGGIDSINTNLIKKWKFALYSTLPEYWRVASGGSIEFTKGEGVRLTTTKTNMYQQVSLDIGSIVGKKYTASILYSSNEFETITIEYQSGNGEKLRAGRNGVNLIMNQDYSGRIAFLVYGKTNTDGPAVSAVKFEEGEQQTLAHLENGIWVLSENRTSLADTFGLL